jgi:hypothetical protein
MLDAYIEIWMTVAVAARASILCTTDEDSALDRSEDERPSETGEGRYGRGRVTMH